MKTKNRYADDTLIVPGQAENTEFRGKKELNTVITFYGDTNDN
jgi:hypothetical protein